MHKAKGIGGGGGGLKKSGLKEERKIKKQKPQNWNFFYLHPQIFALYSVYNRCASKGLF